MGLSAKQERLGEEDWKKTQGGGVCVGKEGREVETR